MHSLSIQFQKKYSENEKKRILYRCWHRGCKETDILLGNFAKAEIFSLSDEELQMLEQLLDIDDAVLYDWFAKKQPIPKEYDNNLIQKIKSFHKL